MTGEAGAWVQFGKVRARTIGGALELSVDGLTTQTKYYKPLLREFFRKHYPAARPRWGDFAVHITMRHVGDPPAMDLDNLAKAVLDSLCGAAFHDDAQVARLLVERISADREGIDARVEKIKPSD
ncbi:RusA family crossover junction endodeoxyribonuclease [bacterium]|nr:RusA family crossover junction endodeoxyribonuclease [bacterium]